ncbi:adenosine deaminase [Schaalia sp. ZJ405]|uniref:adenosine deaminase n=1 Tax=unclassified Schaalia TaxID=2691889 RepID=UPI0013EB04B3|nr:MULTISPECIES: adenosine deaminase [unclassified Schaalia]QPK81202.1 adenosine deaminase [Schaalia sp. ZJ405]
MTVSREFAYSIPKAELHLHLEGTLEPDLKLELAQKNGIDIGQTTVEEVQASYQFDSLTSFLAVYYPAMNVLQDEDDFYRLGAAYFARAKDNGVVRAECFFDPQAHTSRGIAIETVIRGYYRAIEEARAQGISADLILCFLRDMSAQSALETLQAALPYKDMFVGVGLDSDERDNPPQKFAECFALAKDNGLRVTMHCDIDQVGSIDNIRTALTELGTERLDHGTNIVEDPALVELVRERGIGLTCCPVSNSFVTDDMKGKEIVELLGKGVKVSVNSDDPAYFGGYVADNLLALAEKEGLNEAQIAQLARNSIEISWASDEEKAQMLASLEEFVASH